MAVTDYYRGVYWRTIAEAHMRSVYPHQYLGKYRCTCSGDGNNRQISNLEC